MKESLLAEKSMAFAVRVVNCVKYLRHEKKEYVMSDQLLRCGTSIGANIHESLYAQSRADFISKLSISLKEASETSYWLSLLSRTEYIKDNVYDSLKSDTDEIIRLIIASIKTAKKNE